MLLNCGTGEDSWETLGQQGDQTSQSQRKSTLNIRWESCGWSSNTLATWCKEPTLWRRLLGKTEGKRRREKQRMKWLGRITNSMDMNLSTLLEIVEDRGAWHATVHGVTDSWTRLSNLTTEQSHTNTHKTVTYDVSPPFLRGGWGLPSEM